MIDKEEAAMGLIARALDTFGHDKVAVACSFGKDSMVVLHLALRVDPKIKVFTVMTPFKFKETFEFKDRIVKEWKLNIKEYMSSATPDPELPKKDPDLCCKIFKVEPTKEAVKDLDCWITGVRNDEGRTRRNFGEWEVRGGIVKVNPIVTWTEADVWRYTAIHKLPVHPLYAKGYRSLGCEPCTEPGGTFERDGRWRGTKKWGGECGIHTAVLK